MHINHEVNKIFNITYLSLPKAQTTIHIRQERMTPDIRSEIVFEVIPQPQGAPHINKPHIKATIAAVAKNKVLF